jgi:endonuclease III
MKNAKEYEKKVKKLLGKLPKAKGAETFENPIERLVFAILEADASSGQARKAMKALEEEYVDLNELRVSPTKEITEAIGRDYPFARDRADTILHVLGSVYERNFAMNLDALADLPKRQLRRYLTELGLDPYAEGVLASQAFGAHAIPVDQSLVDCLKIEELIHPDSDVADVQGFLERIISQKDGLAAHQCFRKFVADHSSALSKIQQERMDAQQLERQQANARAKAEAEAELAEERGQAPASTEDKKSKDAPGKKKKKKKKTAQAKKQSSPSNAPKKKTPSKTARKASRSKAAKSSSAGSEGSTKEKRAKKASKTSKSGAGKSQTASKKKKKKAAKKATGSKRAKKASKKTTKSKKSRKTRKAGKSSGK